LREVLSVQGDDECCSALLCTRAKCVVVRIWRHVTFLPNLYELCLLTEQIDDLSDKMPSYAEPRENPFVFRKNLLRYEPDESSMLKPITKK